jgi:hypothetical protein
MTVRPWSWFFHSAVASSASLNAAEVAIVYDEVTDSLIGDLRPLKGPTLSCWTGRYEYLRIEIESRQPVGTHIESVTRKAIAEKKRYLELAALCPKLFSPSRSAKQAVTPALKLDVVRQAVVVASRAYDRLHGIQTLGSRPSAWLERELRATAGDTPYLVVQSNGEMQLPPPDDWVIDEFTNVLRLIRHGPVVERGRDFDRMLQYWSSQPGGPLKQATGQLLLRFVREHKVDRFPIGVDIQPREELLLRSIKAS